MEILSLSPETLAAGVVALCFAAGLNVYLTIFALGLMAHFHWIGLPGSLGPIANMWVIVASGVMFAGEFVADKIPGFDVIWNALHTFIRIPLAALLAYAASSHLSPGQQLMVTCIGAAVAAVAHGSKSALRVAVMPSPEPVSNIGLSTAEDGVAVGLTWAATHHPVPAAIAAGALLVLSVGAVWLSVKMLQRGWRTFLDNFRQAW